MAAHSKNQEHTDPRTDARRSGPTSAQLRDELPSRRTPGKTSARDVAAAPFDTDDEAAGRPPQAAALERAAEERARSIPPKYPTSDESRGKSPARAWVVAVLLAILIAVAVLWAITS